MAGGEAGFNDGVAGGARFNDPNSVDIDRTGFLFVADKANHRIRMVQPNGETATLAGAEQGLENGPISTTRFKGHYHVAVAANGTVCAADTSSRRTRRITTTKEEVTTFTGEGKSDLPDGGDGANTQFKLPFSLALCAGRDTFVAVAGNYAIQQLVCVGQIKTLVGCVSGNTNGNFATGSFSVPCDLAFDDASKLYVAGGIKNNLRVIDLGLEIVANFAGNGAPDFVDGKGIKAEFNRQTGIAIAENGEVLVADNRNFAIRRLTSDGELTTLAGGTEGYTHGATGDARLAGPTDLTLIGDGTAVEAATKSHRIRILQ